MQRILRLEYNIPESGKVSPELKDLLSKMLVDNPTQRISMAQIQLHPWYTKDLPEGVLGMNDELPLPGEDAQVSSSRRLPCHRSRLSYFLVGSSRGGAGRGRVHGQKAT